MLESRPKSEFRHMKTSSTHGFSSRLIGCFVIGFMALFSSIDRSYSAALQWSSAEAVKSAVSALVSGGDIVFRRQKGGADRCNALGFGDGRAAFVLAQRKYEQEDADVFAVEGQGARQRAVVGDALGVEGVG